MRIAIALLVGSLAPWGAWAALFVGTISMSFDDVFYRQPVGSGLVLDFEPDDPNPIIHRSGMVILPSHGDNLRRLSFAPGAIACEAWDGSRNAMKFVLLDTSTNGVFEVQSEAALIALWSERTGTPMPALRPVHSYQSSAPLWIIGGGVIAFLAALAMTGCGAVLLFVGKRGPGG